MSIKQRKTGGVWQASYTDGNGHRVRRSTGTTDKRQAQQLHDSWVSESWRADKLGEKVSHTWKEAVVRYLKEKADKKSITTDRQRLIQLDEHLADLTLDQIGPDVLRKIVDDKTRAGLAPATVGQYLALIRQITRLAANSWGWLDRPVAVTMPKVKNERTRVLGTDEERKLISALPERYRDLVHFLLATGLRKGNALALTWDEIDMERKTMTIDGSKMKAGRTLGVPLNECAMKVLRRQERTSNSVFNIRDINADAWSAACQRADIEDLTVHDLRRSWATRLIQAGCAIDRLLKLGGWSPNSHGLLLSRYGHLQADDLRAEIELI